MMETHKISVPRLLIKATLLFVTLNLIFSTFNLLPSLGRLTLYNWLLPGRPRLPYSEDAHRAYSLNLYSLEAMFASHQLSGAPKPADEYRVFVLGDSSVWGFLLENENTLTTALNAAGLHAADGRRVVFYNLGHPTISLTKDLMILDFAMDYDPDLVLWPVTLEAFPKDKQTSSPQVQNNPARVRQLIADFDLALDPNHPDLIHPDFWGRTLIGARRNLADMLRLQLYGFMWAATGIDTYYPTDYELRAVDLEASEEFAGLLPPDLPTDALAFDVMAAGVRRAAGAPRLLLPRPASLRRRRGTNAALRPVERLQRTLFRAGEAGRPRKGRCRVGTRRPRRAGIGSTFTHRECRPRTRSGVRRLSRPLRLPSPAL